MLSIELEGFSLPLTPNEDKAREELEEIEEKMAERNDFEDEILAEELAK